MIDGWLTDEFLRHGAGGQIIRENLPLPNTDSISTRFIKFPGSDKHAFPKGLEELGQIAADHQYRSSPVAREKACIMIYRKSVLETDVDISASEWHGHAVPKEKETILKMAAFALALKQFSFRPSLFSLNFNMAMTEYLFTNIEPTFYQAQAADEDLNVARAPHALIPDNIKAIPVARAPENSLLFITSRVFHRAPTAQDISPDNMGKERYFASIGYIPTNKSERKLKALQRAM